MLNYSKYHGQEKKENILAYIDKNDFSIKTVTHGQRVFESMK